MSLLNLEEGKDAAVRGMVTDYSSIDLLRNLLLSVSESGHGRLLKIVINEDSDSPPQARKISLVPYNHDFRVIPASQQVKP